MLRMQSRNLPRLVVHNYKQNMFCWENTPQLNKKYFPKKYVIKNVSEMSLIFRALSC